MNLKPANKSQELNKEKIKQVKKGVVKQAAAKREMRRPEKGSG
jgi:hypothetical protein